jgi:hypothetical protein
MKITRCAFTIFNGIKDLAVNTFIRPWTEGFNAWSDKDNWHSTTMAWKVETGLYRGSFKQLLSRFTWEFPQTMLGYITNGALVSSHSVKNVSYWGGATAVETYSEDWGGFTLGNYITGNRGLQADPNNTLFQHEYGHYLQSQASGPRYLTKYAIPSLHDATFGAENTHYAHPTEQDANARALAYFEKKYPGFAENGWNHSENTIIGYQRGLEGGYHNAQNQAVLKNAKLKAYGRPRDMIGSFFSSLLRPVEMFRVKLLHEPNYRERKKEYLRREQNGWNYRKVTR